MNFLETILEAKREEVAARKRTVLRSRLEDMPGFSVPRRSLAAACRGADMAVIAEIKKGSPLRSVIRPEFDPVRIAQQYRAGGAAGISVLTDERFFLGSLSFLERVRHAVDLPLLRKDFILDPYQLYEARAYGADAVLLIVAAVGETAAHDLAAEARSLGLETIVEVHEEEEVDRIDWSRFDVAGINNRDLMSFETDLMTSVRLRKYIPPERPVVSESGITSASDLRMLARHNIRAVLVGEHLMKAPDPGEALRELVQAFTGVSNAGEDLRHHA